MKNNFQCPHDEKIERLFESINSLRESVIKHGIYLKIAMGGIGIGLGEQVLKHFKVLGF